jgi:hypothetical protein
VVLAAKCGAGALMRGIDGAAEEAGRAGVSAGAKVGDVTSAAEAEVAATAVLEQLI